MPIEKFKLPRRSYEELCNIIIAYWQLKKAGSLSEVDKICGIGTTNISANNSFLVAVGILDGGQQKKTVTSIGQELGAALNHDNKQEIEAKWQQVINNNDFLSKMISAVRIRKGMGVSDLESHIAYSSGEAKAKYVMTGARTVVDIFKAAGLVEEKDDRVIPKEKVGVGVTERAEEEKTAEDLRKQDIVSRKEGVEVSGLGKGPLSLSIQVRIEAKPSELDGLGDKLRTLIDSLKEHSKNKGRESQ